MTEKIKPSQFIYTYGPGAILDGQNGPRIILGTRTGLFHPNSPLRTGIHTTFHIIDDRMSNSLLDGGKIFRLPNEQDQRVQNVIEHYRTNPFPTWKLCLNRTLHKGKDAHVLYQFGNCPVCNDTSRTGQEAIRFVQACRNGHMDEINWGFLTHGSGRTCQTKYYYYHPGNGTISGITIECPVCSKVCQFGRIYYSDNMPCSGRYPEREEWQTRRPTRRPGSCDAHMKIIQRRAANLRVSETKTLLRIETALTSLHVNLQDTAIRTGLGLQPPQSKVDLKNMLDRLVEMGQIKDAKRNEILRYEWDQINEAIQIVTKPGGNVMSYGELIKDEFRKILDGSEHGIPPQRDSNVRGETICEMIPDSQKKFTMRDQTFRVCPISRLTTITVQTGFRREVFESNNQQMAQLVKYDDKFQDSQQNTVRWFPGVQYTGEGVFIRLDNDGGWHHTLSGESHNQWYDAYNDSDQYSEYLFRDTTSRIELHPVFIWWHTLAHLLIRSIGEDAGYSSASIRERIYLDLDGDRARGGILLYSTQAGDGSMGGLTALVPYFDRMLEMAFDQLDTCSGDPLCLEAKFSHPRKVNGAACYGCAMNSETSCEHRNMWLDRHVLMGNAT